MKFLLLIPLFYIAACGSGSEKKNTVVIGDPHPIEEPISEEISTTTEDAVLSAPLGAINGNFKTENTPFYAYVKNVNKSKGVTTIAFENNKAPNLTLNQTFGATISTLRFDEFDRDLLLINTKIDDPQFHKFHLYILKNGQWLPVVKPFAIHESHKEAQKNPIFVDPKNPNNMFRYYSVFDIDDTNNQDYGWRLHNESISILNR